MEFLFRKDILLRLEKISNDYPNKILRIQGIFNNNENTKENFELLVFKGVTCSTTHPTEFNLTDSCLPINANSLKGELLKAPLSPGEEIILKGAMTLENFLNKKNWS